MRRCRQAARAIVAVLAAAGTAAAATPDPVLARETTSGDSPALRVSGSIRNPVLVRVRVDANPAQPAEVTWTLRCTKGKRIGVRRGAFRADVPHTRRPLFPFPDPARCSLAAAAQLERQGTLTVTLLGR
jgi:hypothetical protein